MKVINFRKAESSDVYLYYSWLNDPLVRSQSFNSQLVEFNDHKNWFEKKLVNINCLMLIFFIDNNENIGQIRIEKEDLNSAIIGISIDSDYRGRGFSTNMLKLATNHFFESNPNFTINAFIKNENINSKFSFENAGFKFYGLSMQNNINCLHYILNYENR